MLDVDSVRLNSVCSPLLAVTNVRDERRTVLRTLRVHVETIRTTTARAR